MTINYAAGEREPAGYGDTSFHAALQRRDFEEERRIMMPINSRQKGAAAERELANILKERGYDARRGQQFHGGGDSPDVLGLPGFHIEAKRVQAFALYPALDQATRDAAEGTTPIVVHRRNGREWVVILRLDDFLNLLERANANQPKST